MARLARIMTGCAGLSILFVALAMLRPIDHDESQYVAAAVLTAHGLLPYRDFAYLQTPLQPFIFAPLAALAGGYAWPMLRTVNALLGAVAVVAIAGAAQRGGASRRMAVVAAGLFATCDILLFSVATARNDALPLALFAIALWLAMRPGGRATAVSIGLLLAAAAAAKISYALPALAYGLYAVWDRRQPVWVAIGALPVIGFVGWTYALAPQGFVFGTLIFPSVAPDRYYRAAGRAWKLGMAAKAIDTLKFLALGPALLAAIVVARRPRPTLAGWLIVAGLIAALLPTPTWRQYLLPVLPPLFVALGVAWTARPPGRALRILAIVFVAAGLAPSLAAVASGGGMVEGNRQSADIARAMDEAGVKGPVATLSPQFLPVSGRSPDPRFATGPFYFRSAGLLPLAEERRLHLVSRVTLADLPPTVLTGGEGTWTAGDPSLDAILAARAEAAGYRRVLVEGGHFTLWTAPAR